MTAQLNHCPGCSADNNYVSCTCNSSVETSTCADSEHILFCELITTTEAVAFRWPKSCHVDPISDTCIVLIKTHEEKYRVSTSSCEFIDVSEVTLIHSSGICELLRCAVTTYLGVRDPCLVTGRCPYFSEWKMARPDKFLQSLINFSYGDSVSSITWPK